MKEKLLISPSILRFLRIWSWIGVILVLIIACLNIIGWIFDFKILKAFGINLYPMTVVTAVSFLFCSAALIIRKISKVGKFPRWIIYFSGLSVSLVGLATVISYIGVLISGEEIFSASTPLLGFFDDPRFRMAFLTAFNFILTGISLMLITKRAHSAVNTANIMILIPLVLNYFAIMSYFLDVHGLTGIDYIPVALNTGIAFSLFCTSFLFFHPDSWILKIFTGNYAGSSMARKLLPGLILLPAVIGWLRIHGETAGMFPSDVGVALVAITYTICFLGLVWLTAYSVNKKDEALRASRERYSTTLKSIGDAVIATDVKGDITFMNSVAETLTGWKLEDAQNKPVTDVFHIINEHTRLEIDNPVEKVLNSGLIVSLANHTILIRKDGSEIPIDDSGAPIHNKEGRNDGVVLVFRDITDRKKAEKIIHDSVQRLRFHFENSPLAVVEWDANYVVTQWSHEAERLFGWTAEETVGKSIGALNMIPEEDIPVVENTMSKLSGGLDRTVVATNRNYTKQGEIRECTWFNSVLVDEKGEMSSVMSLVMDITEQKRQQEEIRLAKEDWERTFDAIPDLVAIIDTDHRIRRSNRAMSEKLKMTAHECVGVECYRVMHCTDSPPEFCPHTQLLKDGNPHELEIWESHWSQDFHISTSPILGSRGELLGSVHIVRDISERKHAEEVIRQTSEYLEKIFNHANAPFICWDPDYKITRFNHAFERMTGYLAEEVLDKDLSLLFPDESKKESVCKIEKTLTGEFWADVEIPILRKDGNIRIALWNSANIYEEDRRTLITTIAQGQDITERKKAEEALHESQERFRSVLDNSNDMIYRLNLRTGQFEYISPSSELILGYSAEELISMDGIQSMSMIHPDDLENVKSWLAKLEKTGTGIVEYRFKMKDGNYRWISNHMSLVRDNDGRPLYRDGNVRNITEVKRYEEEIIAANEELTAFNTAMVGRELRMIELKKEINQLCAQINKPPVYEIENEEVLP